MSNQELRRRFTTTVRNWKEEGLFWLNASPSPLNKLDSSNVERFYETGPELIETIVGAIERGQHVALAGPRGCGKSYCAGQAAKIAQQRGLVPPDGIIKLQGNKELPRDYLIEDDLALEVSDKVVVPKTKYAPLFSRAHRDTKTDRPIDANGTVEILGDGDNGLMRPGQTLVLFLDEVNRFSDGVLDSLLLLLEEGEAILGGKVYRLPVVVLMTMNPPGYDTSARTLSPPLSARIGRQYRLLSPQLNVLTDTITPSALARSTAIKPASAGRGVGDAPAAGKPAAPPAPIRAPGVLPPDPRTLRRAAAATLCCWGNPETEKPSFEYLSKDMQDLLSGLAKSDPALEAAMTTLSGLCHYGPDARALIDWIKAASVVAYNEALALWKPSIQMEGRHFIESAITVIAHKVQDSFSSASQPGNTRSKEEAIHVIVRTLLHGSPEIDALLRRQLDDDASLVSAAGTIWSHDLTGQLRRALITHNVVEDTAVEQWCTFIQSLPTLAVDPKIRASIEQDLQRRRILEPLDGPTKAFSSKNDKAFMTWLAGQLFAAVSVADQPALTTALQEVAQLRTCDRELEDSSGRSRRWLDDDQLLLPAASTIWSHNLSGQLRRAMITHNVVEDTAVERWCAFIQSLPRLAFEPKSRDSIEKDLDDKRILEPLDGPTKAFSSKNDKAFMTWLAGQLFAAVSVADQPALTTALQGVTQLPAYNRALGDYCDRLRCVQDKVWPNGEALMALITKASELARSRHPFQTIAECIDLFWVRAEHYGTDVVDDIRQRLDDLKLPEATRPSVDAVIYEAATTIAKHPARGRATRAALRALSHK